MKNLAYAQGSKFEGCAVIRRDYEFFIRLRQKGYWLPYAVAVYAGEI